MRVVIAIVVLAGCYRPSIGPCQYACENETCPSGLVCSAGMCVASAGDSCRLGDAGSSDPTGDGGIDIHDVNLGEAGCSFGYPVSNIDPCSFAGAAGAWTVTRDTTFQNAPTDSGDVPPPGAIHVATEGGGRAVTVVFVASFQVKAGVTLTVDGPLLVFADSNAEVDGSVELLPVVTCDAPTRQGHPGGDASGAGGAGGGGGGSFGSQPLVMPAGARGGNGDAPGGAGGTPLQDISLVPLVTGCPGGHAGAVNGVPGAFGGAGGGAIQISARASVTIAGQIRASGRGGLSSGSSAAAGGGGGSGGAILLEAGQSIDLTGGFVCANGGGGGASAALDVGETGACSTTAAAGVTSAAGSGSGGNGETGGISAGQGGDVGVGDGGGGGGGGVGIIRLTAPEIFHMVNSSPPAFD